MMKNKLPCAVVRDLMPSYIEGLTEKETMKMVQEHLCECEDCARKYRDMKEQDVQQSAQEIHTVDYLKTVRRRNRKKIILVAALVSVTLFAGVWTKIFVIGSPLSQDGFYYEAKCSDDGNTLHISAHMLGSATVFSWVDEQHSDSEVRINARQAVASFINRDGIKEWDVSVQSKGNFCVNVLGNTVYQNGLIIEQKTNRQWESRTPYVGSMHKVAGVAQWLPLPEKSFTNQLHTDKSPYGWTIAFEEALDTEEKQKMEKSAVLALALIDNLEAVYWTEPGSEEQGVMTLQQANAQINERNENYNRAHGVNWASFASVKDYAESPYTLQQLKSIFEIQ